MRRLIQLLALFLAVLATPAAAQTQYYYYYAPVRAQPAATRYVSPPTRVESDAKAAYGPFRVLDERTAALVGATDSHSPAWFQAMLRDYPGIATLQFVECPGTYDDRANLALGRMIRSAGIAAHVPEGGSVRSGAVELVLAGNSLTIDDGAEFAVHAWLDEDGYEATDYAAESPMNRRYLSYYREMGMDDTEASSFYAMTNSVPFADARWLTGREMRRWVSRAKPTVSTPPRLASRKDPSALPVAPMLALTATGRVPLPEVQPVAAAGARAEAMAPMLAFAVAAPAFPAKSLVALATDVPALRLAPRLAYLDLGLTLF